MNIVNKVKVTICGKDYSLQTDETPEYISGLAQETEKQIFDLIKLRPGFGIQNAAVFVALTALDEAHKAETNIENIRAQIKSSVNEAGRARAAKEKLSAKVKELEERIAELEKENKELKKRPPFDCEQLVLENTVSPAVTVYAGDEKAEGKTASPTQSDTEKAAEDKNGESAKGQAGQAQADQSSGNSSGDRVSSGSKEQTGEKEQEQKAGKFPKVNSSFGGGGTAASGNGNSSQNDNVK